jgi:predicted Zn-dependent peptidase
MRAMNLHDDRLHISTLANGVRVLTIAMPQVESASVALFVRSGSAHETPALNGIGHFIEHMLFKGTAGRDARRINLDAENLGAEVNAHTDKDHTAFYMHGLAADAGRLLAQLGDLLSAPVFPADELERERQVLLHECTEDEDDPLSNAFKLFDLACWGRHPLAQGVIGPRKNLQKLQRADLVAHVQGLYTGHNVVVAVAGAVVHDDMHRAAQAALGGLPAGQPNTVAPAVYQGGVRTRRLAGSSQSHLVLGFATPSLAEEDLACTVAAAVFGEGMSSPLLQTVREQQALAYYTGCSADLLAPAGQWVVEASTSPAQLEPLLRAVLGLLTRYAQQVDEADLQRAQRQLLVRRLRAHERPYRRLEDAALDLLARGAVRSTAQWRAAVMAVTAEQVRAAFARMLASRPTVAVAGALPRAATQRVKDTLAQAGLE